MLWLAAALVAGTGDAVRAPVTAERQAQAMVRIARPGIVLLGQGATRNGERAGISRDSVIRLPNGTAQAARLVEFQ